jgi:hypothetical protein
MANRRPPSLAGWLISLLVSLAAGALISHFGSWFDGLSHTELFFVAFGTIALILFGTEWFYRSRYGRENISETHLKGLQATAQLIFDGLQEKKSTLNVNGKDCRDLFSHRPDIQKASEKWDRAVDQWMQATITYNNRLTALFEVQGFVEPRFDRAGLQSSFFVATRMRELSALNGISPKHPLQWGWRIEPTHTPTGMRNDIYVGPGQGALFIRDFDRSDDPIDAGECEARLISLFDEADSSPELEEMVRLENVLVYGDSVAEFKELLHEFGRRDQQQIGRGCKRCN